MSKSKVDWFGVFAVMAAAILILWLLLTIPKAFAADAQLSWTHPTQREDGTALPLAEIKETQIDWAACAAGNVFPPTPAGTKAVAAPATSTTVTGLTYGTWCFRARTVDTANLVSNNTGTVWRQYVAPPKPPVLTVTNIVAYEINLTPSGLVKLGRDVGRVPLGTPCSEDLIVANNRDTYYSVPASAVTLYRQPKSSALVAVCEYAASG